MLSIWRDWKEILYFELLPAGKTINSDVCCQRLDDLKTEIGKKTPSIDQQEGVVFHHDNARPHASLKTQKKMRARQGNFTTNIVFLRSCSIGLSPF